MIAERLPAIHVYSDSIRLQTVATMAPMAANHTMDAAGIAAAVGPKWRTASTYASVGDLIMVSTTTVRAARSGSRITRDTSSAHPAETSGSAMEVACTTQPMPGAQRAAAELAAPPTTRTRVARLPTAGHMGLRRAVERGAMREIRSPPTNGRSTSEHVERRRRSESISMVVPRHIRMSKGISSAPTAEGRGVV